METKPVLNSEEKLLAILVKLEECRSALTANGHDDTAHLVSVATLDIRTKLHNITDADLKLVCDVMVAQELVRGRQQEPPPEPKVALAPGERPLLRVVK